MNNVRLNPREKLSKGYLILFTSWENDGDQYRNVHVNVKTKSEALVLIEIAKMFATNKENSSLGNKEHDDFDDLKESIIETLKENITNEDVKVALDNYVSDVWNEMDGDDFYCWLIDNILNEPVEYDYGFCRKVEEIELYEVLEDFVMPAPTIPLRKVE